MKRTCYLGLSLFLILALGAPSFAQNSLAADNAYRDFYNEKDPQKKLALGEKFLAEFKESTYRAPVYQTLLNLHVTAQSWPRVMDTVEKLPALLPTADNALKTKFYPYGMAAAQQLNNADKIIEFADKILAVDPNNLQAQIAAATTLPEKSPQDQAANDKAFDLANKALAGVEQFFSKPPAGMTPAQAAQEKAGYEVPLHSAIAYVYLNRKDYPKASEKYEQIVKMTPKDGIVRYRLGLAYQYQAQEASKLMLAAIDAENAAKRAQPIDQPLVDELTARRQGIEADAREKRDKAIDELASAAAIGGIVAQPARDAVERLYKVKNNDSLDGLDQLINSKKQ